MRSASPARVGLCAIALLVVVGCRRDRESAPVAAQPAVTAQPSVAAQPAVTAQPVAPPPKPAQLAHVTIKALGMTCEESCPMRVRYALAGIQDIYELGFDLPNESIFVSYDASLGPAKQVTKPMLAAIKNAGFDPWLAKESWPADAQAQVLWRDVK